MMQIVSKCALNALDGVINKIGATSLFASIGLVFASGSGAIELSEAVNGAWGMTQWLGLLAGIGTASFILKNLVSARSGILDIKIKNLTIEKEEKEKNNPGK